MTPDGVSPETPKPSVEPSVKPSTPARARKSQKVSIVRDGVYDAIMAGWALGDDGLTTRIRAALMEVWEFTDEDWITRFVKWYHLKNRGLSLPIDETKLKNWYGKFHKDPAAIALTEPQKTGTSNYADEMRAMTEARYKEKGLLK